MCRLWGRDVNFIFFLHVFYQCACFIYCTVYPFLTHLQCLLCHESSFYVFDPLLWFVCSNLFVPRFHYSSYIMSPYLLSQVLLPVFLQKNFFFLFHIHFRISLSNSMTNCWEFDESCIGLGCNQFEETLRLESTRKRLLRKRTLQGSWKRSAINNPIYLEELLIISSNFTYFAPRHICKKGRIKVLTKVLTKSDKEWVSSGFISHYFLCWIFWGHTIWRNVIGKKDRVRESMKRGYAAARDLKFIDDWNCCFLCILDSEV